MYLQEGNIQSREKKTTKEIKHLVIYKMMWSEIGCSFLYIINHIWGARLETSLCICADHVWRGTAPKGLTCRGRWYEVVGALETPHTLKYKSFEWQAVFSKWTLSLPWAEFVLNNWSDIESWSEDLRMRYKIGYLRESYIAVRYNRKGIITMQSPGRTLSVLEIETHLFIHSEQRSDLQQQIER